MAGRANDRHSGCSVRPRRGFYSTEIIQIKYPKGKKFQNKQGIWCPRRAAGFVKDGQCSEGGGPRKGRSPVAARGS